MIAGLGHDLVEIGRIRAAVARHGRALLERIWTAAEREYAFAAEDPAPRLAARFAAKEAVAKALGCGFGERAGWLEIEITRGAGGAPGVRLSGRARARAGELGIVAWQLSLTHARELASAVAIAERRD